MNATPEMFSTHCIGQNLKKMQMIKAFWKETNGRQKAVSSIIARPISCIKKINNHITWKNLFQGLQLYKSDVTVKRKIGYSEKTSKIWKKYPNSFEVI